MSALPVSIVVCTRNRGHLLPRLVAELGAQVVADGAEIIVVDNGSTDDTASIVAGLARANPALPLSYVLEPEPGLSRARNRGVQKSDGEIVIFVDDDALPEVGWLKAHEQSFDDPQVGTVGGPIRLLFEGATRPAWLTESYDKLLGAYNLGPDRFAYDVNGFDTPSGGNMSFRRTALEEVGLFDIALGRRDAELLAGEEYELGFRLLRKGWSAVYEPRAAVLHLIEADRLRVSYFRSRLRSNVTTSALLAERGFATPSRYARARRLVANLIRDGTRVLLSRRNGDRLYHALRVEAFLLGARSTLTGRSRR